jgi:dienelactone hydrolase
MSGSDVRKTSDSWRPLRRADAPLGARIAIRVLAWFSRVVVGIIDVLAASMPGKWLPPVTWPRPSGSYAVGVRDVTFQKPSDAGCEGCGEAATHSLRVWYPAAADGSGQAAPLLSHAEAEAIRLGASGMIPASMLRQMQTVRTASILDAPILAPEGQRWPVLLFSHGLGGTAAQNTQLCEALASHGYWVIALAHETGAAATRQPDGSYRPLSRAHQATALDPWLYACARKRRRAHTPKARDEATRCLARIESLQAEQAVWVANIRCTLDGFAGNDPHPFLRSARSVIDLGRIGLIGMSFGGSASATAACTDSRVTAVVNLDGGQVGPTLYDAQIPVPLLLLQSAAALSVDGRARNDDFYEPIESAHDSGTVFRFWIRGSGHLSYSDVTLFGRGSVRKILGTSGTEGNRMLEIVANSVRRFCDQHVKGEAGAMFPGDLMASWPELQPMTRKAVPSQTE